MLSLLNYDKENCLYFAILLAIVILLPATFSYWSFYHHKEYSWRHNFYYHPVYEDHYHHYQNDPYFYHHPEHHQPWWTNDTLVKERINYIKQINPYAAERMEEMIELKRKYFNEYGCPCHHFWK